MGIYTQELQLLTRKRVSPAASPLGTAAEATPPSLHQTTSGPNGLCSRSVTTTVCVTCDRGRQGRVETRGRNETLPFVVVDGMGFLGRHRQAFPVPVCVP